jgi:lysophospholipase L1-like esterase
VDILCNGCSYTSEWNASDLRRPRNAINYSWVNYLPDETYNIATRASGIESVRLKNFLKENIQLTHFIYQIPNPARQPIEFEQHPLNCKCINCLKGYRAKMKPVDTVWRALHKGANITVFNNHEIYLNKVLKIIDENVNIVRKKRPNIKIIFFRYELTRHPLLYEFSKSFYNTTLYNYCKNNDITYIYEDNFHTNWFYKNKLTGDHTHPNKAGAKMIADKIIEYL